MPVLGDFFVSGTGFGSSFFAGFQARAVRWATYLPADRDLEPKVNHAGVYVGKIASDYDAVVEAMPGGAILTPVDDYLGDNTLWSNGKFLPSGTPELTARHWIADAAVKRIGTPYGWGDILALTLATRFFNPNLVEEARRYEDQPWWVRRLINSKTLTCAQLVDQIYLDAGIHLFTDDRLPGFVPPADLHKAILRHL